MSILKRITSKGYVQEKYQEKIEYRTKRAKSKLGGLSNSGHVSAGANPIIS